MTPVPGVYSIPFVPDSAFLASVTRLAESTSKVPVEELYTNPLFPANIAFMFAESTSKLPVEALYTNPLSPVNIAFIFAESTSKLPVVELYTNPFSPVNIALT